MDNSDTWAVLASTSRFWFNYRHMANALAIYQSVRNLGIPDHRIILMTADDFSCDPRNAESGLIFAHPTRGKDLYQDARIDYRRNQVTVKSFMNLLVGSHDPSACSAKRLDSHSKSNVLIYLTGHGGDGFLKFHDLEELTDVDLARAFDQMHVRQRYRSILCIIDTCQAASMISKIRAPNIVSIASSRVGESSYSHHVDYQLGVPLMDRFTNHLFGYLTTIHPNSSATIGDFLSSLNKISILSTPTVSSTMNETIDLIRITDYFAHNPDVHLEGSRNVKGWILTYFITALLWMWILRFRTEHGAFR